MSKPKPKHVIAPSCSVCVFYPAGGLCRRHAPTPGQEEFELVFWPRVRPTDRCGDGEKISDGTGAGVVLCGTCSDWERPNGEGVKPDYRKGLTAEWWTETGYCTRRSPSPSPDEDQPVFWRATHAADGCGDGRRIEVVTPVP